MADSKAIPASKRFETPIFDSLVPRQQQLVINYCHLLDKVEAATLTGYKNNNHQLKKTINDLFSNPRIVAAIDEYLEAKLEQLDSGRAAVCQKLMNQSLAEMHDLVDVVPYVNGHGVSVEGKTMIQPKAFDQVDERFRSAICFVRRNPQGSYEWDSMGQHRAVTQLSKLMMWDQSLLDQNPALVFQFGGVQDTPYETPTYKVDTSLVDEDEDEVDKLLTH